MALSASVFKVNVQLSDMDRHHYFTYSLTLAKHPSETSERMMARLLAFLRYADDRLVFTRGLSETDEPDLWMKDRTGQPELWIEVGLPTAKRIVWSSRQSQKVVVFAYGRNVAPWWKKNRQEMEKVGNLELVVLPVDLTESLAKRVSRTWQCLIQDNVMSLIGETASYELDFGSCTRLGAGL